MHKHNQTKDFLIRNMPMEVFVILEQSAKEHHRSKTQEAIVAITRGLSIQKTPFKKPKPFKWKKRMTSKFIDDAIKEGRE